VQDALVLVMSAFSVCVLLLPAARSLYQGTREGAAAAVPARAPAPGAAA
jgi:hypothetical protein